MPEKSIQRRAVLYFPEYTFDISDVNEDMEQSSAVNPVSADADFAIGVSSMSELKFSLNNLYGVISENSLANKEFLLQRGEVTEYESVLDVYKKVRKPLFVQRGGFTFAASDRAPYLSVYDSNFALQDAPAQPSQPVKSLFIVDGKLYCVHDIEPTITAYSVSGGTLKMLPQTKLTPFFERKMTQEYAKRGRCFNKQGDTVMEYVSVFTDMKISDIIKETWEYSNFGYYIVTNPEKINDIKISVLAYDRMKRFEVVADGFLDSVTYPVPLKTFLTRLCAFIGVEFTNKTLVNENYSVPRNFKTDGVTCRQVLQWIAQITANFAYIGYDGKLNLSWYTNADSQIDASNSTVIDIADYVVQPIDKAQARAFESDIGVIVPIDERKANAYIIENNPLLYATEDAQIRPAVTNIYNAIKEFSYVPFTAKTYVVDKTVRAGMIVSATTIKDKTLPAYIMQSTLKGVRGLTAEYAATGNEYRKIQTDAVNQAIVMLNGRTNSIISTIDKFSVTLSEVKTETEQNSSDIDNVADRVTKNEASLTVQAGQIASKVSQTDYTGNTISSLINQTATDILIKAERVDIQGMLSAGDAKFVSKTGDAEMTVANAEILIKLNNQTVGQIWPNRTTTGMGIEYKNSLWISRTTSEGSTTAASFDGNGSLSLNASLGVAETVLCRAIKCNTSIESGGPIKCAGGIQADNFYTEGFGFGVSRNGAINAKSLTLTGDFSAKGSKNSVQSTKNYGERLINAYETAEYYFGDIGESEVKNGCCEIQIEPIFLECVNTEVPYQIFLTPYASGNIYVSSRNKYGFSVSGDNIPFGWELKAKRLGYENCRLSKRLKSQAEKE